MFTALASPEESLKRIQAALQQTIQYLQCDPVAGWHVAFCQLNRLAHLHFLRRNGVKAPLVLVNFIGDHEVHGPRSQAEWEAAYQIFWHVLGVGKRDALSPYMIHAYPAVAELSL